MKKRKRGDGGEEELTGSPECGPAELGTEPTGLGDGKTKRQKLEQGVDYVDSLKMAQGVATEVAHVSEKTSPWHEIGPTVANARGVESNNVWLYQAAERYEICQELVKELGDVACGDPDCAKPMPEKRLKPEPTTSAT